MKARLEMRTVEEAKMARGIEDAGRIQRLIDNEAVRLMAPRTPKDTGALIASVDPSTIGTGRIVQGQGIPYLKWYWQEANFQGAPMRGTHWFEKMVASGGRESILASAKRMAGAK